MDNPLYQLGAVGVVCGVLLAGVFKIFRWLLDSYTTLVKNLQTVVENNTKAMTVVAERVTVLEQRVTSVENKLNT
jgi:hypothetical protein